MTLNCSLYSFFSRNRRNNGQELTVTNNYEGLFKSKIKIREKFVSSFAKLNSRERQISCHILIRQSSFHLVVLGLSNPPSWNFWANQDKFLWGCITFVALIGTQTADDFSKSTRWNKGHTQSQIFASITGQDNLLFTMLPDQGLLTEFCFLFL